MCANGLVAVGCADTSVVILDSNSNYSEKQKIAALIVDDVRLRFCLLQVVRSRFCAGIALTLASQCTSRFLQTDLFLPSDAMKEPIMFMALINPMGNMNNSLNGDSTRVAYDYILFLFLAYFFPLSV